MKGGDTVPLAAIRTDNETGRALADEARALLRCRQAGGDAISLDDLDERVEVLSPLGFNGDGIVPETAADDAETRR